MIKFVSANQKSAASAIILFFFLLQVYVSIASPKFFHVEVICPKAFKHYTLAAMLKKKDYVLN